MTTFAFNPLRLFADGARLPAIKSWPGLDATLPLPDPRAAVVFDGLSLRELPLLLQMAQASGLRVKSLQVVATCLPTETMNFCPTAGRPCCSDASALVLKARVRVSSTSTAVFRS